MVRFGSKNKQHKDTCEEEIRLSLQLTTLHSIVNAIGKTYVVNLRINKHALLLVSLTELGKVQFSIQYLLTHFANAT